MLKLNATSLPKTTNKLLSRRKVQDENSTPPLANLLRYIRIVYCLAILLLGTAAYADAQYTIWPSTATPAISDVGANGPVELGVSFKSDVSGYITGIRFYKSANNTGAHLGHLWSSTGTLLATVTFTGESASGWQQASFSNPVLITANTVYVASYYTQGHWSANWNYFATGGVDNAPLHALANANGAADGVYAYSNGTTFPTSTYQSGNYWVDVAFKPNSGTPANGSPAMTVSTNSLSFGNDPVGTSLSQPLTVTNSGSATLSITQVNQSGSTAFTLSGYSLPISIAAGQKATITAKFLPASVGAASGSISIVSNASTTPTAVSLGGSGVAATYALSVSPTSLSFGNVTVGTSSASQSVNVTNTGNSSVGISKISVNGTGYAVSGGGAPVTVSPSQTLTLKTQFSPTATGTDSGSLSIVSNASGSPAAVSLSGTGMAASAQHSVALNWNASTSSVSGYNVYRTTVSGSSYTKMNSSLLTGLTYSDASVQSGTTYYYVTTSVDSAGNESTHSNEVTAVIP